MEMIHKRSILGIQYHDHAGNTTFNGLIQTEANLRLAFNYSKLVLFNTFKAPN